MKREQITKLVNGEIYYLCTCCKRYLPNTKFNIDNTNLHGNRGGRCQQCKDCQRKKYYSQRNKLFYDDHFAMKTKLQSALKGARRRAKEHNKYIDIDLEFLYYLWNKQNGKCALTGIPLTYKFYEGRVNSNVSIDRIDSSKGYAKDNVQLVCMAANQMKNDLSQDEFLQMCQLVINNAKHNYEKDSKTS